MKNLFKFIILTSITILFISLPFLLFNAICYADEIDTDEDFSDIESIVSNAIISKEPTLDCQSAIIFDRTTKQIIFGKKENTKRAMASTTKIMTAMIVIENCNLYDIVTISKKAANTGGSCLKINPNDKISVRDLLCGLLLRSGNDCAVALAEYTAGDVASFADLMNKKAQQLNLKDTNFVTPHGLDNENHYTTAYELALLTDYALNNETFQAIVSTKSTTITINNSKREISNTNELLGNLAGVDGVKTGFTGNAMRCLVTSCTRNGNQIITVVLGANTKKQRTSDSIKLIEYAFNNFKRINIEEIAKKDFEDWKQINLNRIYINKGITNNIELELVKLDNPIIPIKIGEENAIYTKITCLYNLEAPIYKNEIIGALIIKKGDEVIESTKIICKNNIQKKDIYYYFKELINNICYTY